MTRTPYLISAILPLLLAMAPEEAGAGQEPRSWFVEQGYVPPSNDQIVACHGYGCVRRTSFAVEPELLRKANAILKSGRTSAEAERRALADVVRIYTASLPGRFGGAPDAPKSPPSMSGVNGQMDCVDEAANTTSLLLVLQDHGLLVHHEVERPQSRGIFIDGRYPHTTAIIAEKQSHEEWAVDPWAQAPGQRPEILPLAQWRQDS